jgi:general nucleoside transport system ATP-binding protein
MLELRGITKQFGNVLANDHVNISVKQGTIHAIVGENGAGKSTAMKIAYGFYGADSGDILVDGEPCKLKSPSDAIRLGIGMVQQHFTLVDTMTVAENIILGAETGKIWAIDLKRAKERIVELEKSFKLSVDPDALIETLSVGERQRVELLKALYHQVRLLILDEPTAVLTPQEIEDLFSILSKMREQGKTIVIITHKLSEVLKLSDEITVMRDGRVVGELRTEDTNANELARLMVGREVLLQVERDRSTYIKEANPTLLRVKDLSVKKNQVKQLDNINFEIRAGEILGVAGIEGNGQTELIEALAGLIPSRFITGTIEFDNRDINLTNARLRKEMGIAHIPEDRHRRGLLLEFNLKENAILGIHNRKPFTSYGGIFLNIGSIDEHTEKLVRDFDIRSADANQRARELSGGNQQKLIVGREFSIKPKLLLVAQPTRGVDIGAIEFIHQRLIALSEMGCAVLLVSADLEELRMLSDRLIVLYQGRIASEVDPLNTSIENLGLLMSRGMLD